MADSTEPCLSPPRMESCELRRLEPNGCLLSSMWNRVAGDRALLFELRGHRRGLAADARPSAYAPACRPPDCRRLPGSRPLEQLGRGPCAHSHGSWVLLLRRIGQRVVPGWLD